MKKLISLILALLMVASLSITAFAADEPQKGSITVNGVSAGNTYTIYKMMDLTYNEANGAYSYTVDKTSPWYDFFANNGKTYQTSITLTEAGVASWVGESTEEVKADFAKKALAYAEENTATISPVASLQSTEDNATLKFTDLELGYYLVDSTMGALCGLTTTNYNALINAKNSAPVIDKQVHEDSTNQWAEKNTADVGQVVEFRTTIYVHAGAQNFVLHDKMQDSLTFVQDSSIEIDYGTEKAFRGIWKIEHVTSTGTHTVPAEKYTITVEPNCTDNCTFEIAFTQTFCDEMKDNDKIIVYYNAMLNEKALIAEKNTNTAWLDFGDDHHTEEDVTETFTYAFDLVKTDNGGKLLDGASFKIYPVAEGGDPIALVQIQNNEEGIVYRRAVPGETNTVTEFEVTGGIVRIQGFDNGTYYLEETQAPDGYNELTERKSFTISDKNLDASIIGDILSTGSGVQVINNTGALLPETGATGTMLFITFGTFVVLGTGMLLVTKKRMSMIVE